MSKKSKNPAPASVQIAIEGSGKNIWAYALNDDQFRRVQKELRPGGEDAIDLIQSDYEAGALICWGLGADKYPKQEIIIKFGEKIIKPKILYVDANPITSEDIKAAREDSEINEDCEVIAYGMETSEGLQDVYWGDSELTGFSIENTNHIFMEVVEWNSIKLSLDLPISHDKFDLGKLFIWVREMDSAGEISSFVYPHEMGDGWPNGEHDIVGVIYDGQKYKFDAESSGAQGRRWWAFVRDDGEWEEDHATNIFFKYD